MTELSDLYKHLGFSDAKTYIQSGNVIFSGIDGLVESEMSLKIEKAILERFNYIVPVMSRTVGELKDLFTSNPYLNEDRFDPAKMAVIFLHENPAEIQLQKVKGIDYPPDKFNIIGREIFIYCPNGFGRTKIYTNFFENKMGVKGTGRNWKTLTTILSLIENKTM
jgi:uncharacterized protein (DUF1697 family)